MRWSRFVATALLLLAVVVFVVVFASTSHGACGSDRASSGAAVTDEVR